MGCTRGTADVRIALFSEVFLPKMDGIVRTLTMLLEHLAAGGHESILFAPAGGPTSYAATKVVGFKGYTFPLYPELTLVPPTAAVAPWLASFNPDVIHVVGPTSLGIAGLLRAGNRPVVASYHTDLPGFAVRWGLSPLRAPLRRMLRWAHNKADLTLAPSRATRDDLVRMGVRNVAVWSRGVDAQQFAPSRRSGEMRERLTAGRVDAPLLLYVGRLSPEKRCSLLRPLIDALPGARLAIVGDGPSRASLEKAFARTPTVFTGWLSGEQLAAAYASSDVFVFPGANETFGNVALEAMASGLPVVVPRSGGLLDHVVDGETGLLVEPEEPGGFIMAARWLLEDGAVRRRLGRTARRHACQRTWHATLDGLVDVYRRLIRGRPLARAA